MKRAAMVIAVLGMCAWSFGQSNTKPATQKPPAGQAAQPAGQAAAPAGKRPVPLAPLAVPAPRTTA
jgi:hypothetical protein